MVKIYPHLNRCMSQAHCYGLLLTCLVVLNYQHKKFKLITDDFLIIDDELMIFS